MSGQELAQDFCSDTPRSAGGSQRRQGRSRSASVASTTSRGRSPAAAAAKAVQRVGTYSSIRNEYVSALEQQQVDTYTIFKYVPKHKFGTKAPPTQFYAWHNTAGFDRSLARLDEVGLTPLSLIREHHAVMFTVAMLKSMHVPEAALDAVNYFTYKAYGTRMVINSLFGPEKREKYLPKGALTFAKFKTGSKALDLVLNEYVAGEKLPLRDAAYLWSLQLPQVGTENALDRYRKAKAELTPKATINSVYTRQQHAFYGAVREWIQATKEAMAEQAQTGKAVNTPGTWGWNEFKTTTAQSQQFFASLDWSIVERATTDAIAVYNQKQVERYQRVHARDFAQ